MNKLFKMQKTHDAKMFRILLFGGMVVSLML